MIWIESITIAAIVGVGVLVCSATPEAIEYGTPTTQEESEQKLLRAFGHLPESYRVGGGSDFTVEEIIKRARENRSTRFPERKPE